MASSSSSAAATPARSTNALLLAHAATATVSALGAATVTWLLMRRRAQASADSTRARMLELADASCTAGHGMTPSQFNAAAHALVDQITEYRATLRSRPVKARVEPGYLAKLVPDRAPEEGEDWAAIQADIERVIMPGMMHWGSPKFMAYFPAFASYPSLLGEMLCSATNSIGFSWVGSPASTELETRCMDWVAKLINLPPEFTHQQGKGGGGCLQGTAAEAGAVAMLAGKAKAMEFLRSANGDVDLSPAQHDAAVGKLVAYISDQTHGIIAKGCKIMGVPGSRLRVLPARPADNFGLQLPMVQMALRADRDAGLIPFFICLTIGTTSSTAIDSVVEIAGWVRAEFPEVFIHVDSAYAGSFMALPTLRAQGLFDGLEHVDSFSFNPHKSMLVAFDCSCFFVRTRRHLLGALSLANDGEYLRNAATDSGKVLDLKDWQLPFGRRFRSLKLWFVLRSYGATGVRAHLQTAIDHAQRFKDHIRSSPGGRFKLVCEPLHFGLVCFVAVPPPSAGPLRLAQRNAINERIKEECNATGQVFFITTQLAGETIMRLACNGEAQQNMGDVEAVWKIIEEQTNKLWQEKGWNNDNSDSSSSSSSSSQ